MSGHAFLAIVRRDARRRLRRPAEWLTPVFFFAATVSVFAIATGGEANLLRQIAPGILWSAALFAVLLTQDAIFNADIADGFAEQLALSDLPLTVVTLAKALAHWLFTGAPLIAVVPMGALLLNMPPGQVLLATALLVVGALVFSLLATFVAALVALANNSVLAILLALPLAVPTVIFGTAATSRAIDGEPVLAAVLFLLASATLALTVLPVATAGILRVSVGFA